MGTRRVKHWGWGHEDEAPSPEETRATAAAVTGHLGFGTADVEAPVPLEAIDLPAPRIEAPAALRGFASASRYDRVRHALGRAYRDVVRGFRGQVDHPPDLVATPRDEGEVEAVLAWAAGANVAVVPFGGGTSVVGGVEPRGLESYDGVVTLSLRGLTGVREVDDVSRLAKVGAGTLGPELEADLATRGLTFRFFPQSFEFSSVGGWVVTRAGGHFATGPTHVDDLVASVRALTPSGAWESRRLPGSGAGPSPDRLLLGSEGTLGVVTEAWLRVRPRPTERRAASVRFPGLREGADAVRAIVQDDLRPANLRLLDPEEARATGAAPEGEAVLVVGLESAGAPLDEAFAAVRRHCEAHGGRWEAKAGREGAAGAWRQAFLRAPYLRDTLVAAGIVSETFETAITWDRFPALHAEVTGAVREALRERCGGGSVWCRFTHAYPDGPAPYFTVLAPAPRGDEVAVWDAVKAVASEALAAAGGTITHHHAVGRDHRPWYDRQRPDPFAAALAGAKAAVDPAWVLNPGVLVDRPV